MPTVNNAARATKTTRWKDMLLPYWLAPLEEAVGQAAARPAGQKLLTLWTGTWTCAWTVMVVPTTTAAAPTDTHVDVRHRVRWIDRRRAGPGAGRPAAVVGRRRRRQWTVGRRNDLE